MSETVHPWCRDVSRDEAIRAAEDAAAAERTPLPDHRDLPQAVKELRERVARLEDHFADASKMVTPSQPTPVPPAADRAIVHIDTTDTIDERGWHEPVAPRLDRADGRRVGAVDPRPAAAGGADGASGASGPCDRGAAVSARDIVERLRDPSQPMGDYCDSSKCDKDKAYAASEIARLRARVAELEAAPAENAGGEVEPVAWGVVHTRSNNVLSSWKNATDAQQESDCLTLDTTVVPLFRAPPQPRGWLTREERDLLLPLADALERRATELEQPGTWGSLLPRPQDLRAESQTIYNLLARSSPPRVRLPEPPFARSNVAYGDWMMCIEAVKKSLAAAGVEVE